MFHISLTCLTLRSQFGHEIRELLEVLTTSNLV